MPADRAVATLVAAALAAAALAAAALAACSSGSASSSSRSTTSSRPVSASPAAVAAKPSSGCGAAPVAAGQQRLTLTSSGAERWYLRHVPPVYDGTHPLPVVVDLHGYTEGAELHSRTSGLGPYGDEHGFVTVTPQGTGPIARWETELGSPDVRFIGDLLDEVERSMCVDRNRIFVTGYSHGAFMTSTVACAYADRVAAAAPVAGIQNTAGCKPARPVPVVAFHGTADGFVAYDGGLGSSALDLPSPDGSGNKLRDLKGIAQATRGPSVPANTAAWAKRNRCAPKPVETTIASDVTRIAYRCPNGADVQLYRVTGGGHTWPGSQFSKGIEKAVGPTTFSISANDVMWEFFQQHPRR